MKGKYRLFKLVLLCISLAGLTILVSSVFIGARYDEYGAEYLGGFGLNIFIVSTVILITTYVFEKLTTSERSPLSDLRLSNKSKRTTIILGSVLFVGIFLAYDLSGVGGNIKFYSKWAECGHMPLTNGLAYKGPKFYESAETYSLMRSGSVYFCTPLEAERAGYSASSHSYSFPNLDAVGEDWPIGVR